MKIQNVESRNERKLYECTISIYVLDLGEDKGNVQIHQDLLDWIWVGCRGNIFGIVIHNHLLSRNGNKENWRWKQCTLFWCHPPQKFPLSVGRRLRESFVFEIHFTTSEGHTHSQADKLRSTCRRIANPCFFTRVVYRIDISFYLHVVCFLQLQTLFHHHPEILTPNFVHHVLSSPWNVKNGNVVFVRLSSFTLHTFLCLWSTLQVRVMTSLS